jgi:hypothetical protein
MIADGIRNKAFDAKIPLVDTSFSKVLKVTKVITNKLFEFFVKVEDFEKRALKVSPLDLSLVCRALHEFQCHSHHSSCYMFRSPL